MMARWRISMQTASKVIGAMKTEGLAVPSVGRDTIVAPGAAARIAAAAQGTALAPAASLPPAPGTAVTAVTAGKAAAPGPVAEILAIPPGRRALRRTETREDNGQPASLTVAWYPPEIADRAPRLADSQPLPAGTLAYIAEATGTRAARADEDYAAEPRRRRHRRGARHQPRLTGPDHPHPVLHGRRQAHRVRRNHHARRAPLRPQLRHHRQLTAATQPVTRSLAMSD